MNEPKQPQTLNLHDLLRDESLDVLSEYLTVSIFNDGHNAHLNVSTVEDQPVIYSAVFYDSKATDLSEMLAEHDYIDTDAAL